MTSASLTRLTPAHNTLTPNANHASNSSGQADTVTTPLLQADVATEHDSSGRQIRPPLPQAWDFTKPIPYIPRRLQPLVKPTINILVMISHGHSSLEEKWKLADTPEKFVQEKKKVSDRLAVITLVASLLMTCLMAFITTVPPAVTILDYTMRGPYICLWAAFGVVLGGVIVGFTDIFVMTTCGWEWTLNKLMATRWRVLFVLIALAYPFFSIGIATIVCALGILSAAWLSEDHLVRIGCVFLLLVPASLIIPFAITQMFEVPGVNYRTPQSQVEA
ncbi:hypothetical protein BC629DRAFT_1195906 [Irpex lacteus]|nr:hypothetical protein BC629DRAFT_1195906 [Irpex lacteus]